MAVVFAYIGQVHSIGIFLQCILLATSVHSGVRLGSFDGCANFRHPGCLPLIDFAWQSLKCFREASG